MSKTIRLFIFLAAMVLLLYHPPPADAGQVILDDKFQKEKKDDPYINPYRTTASVHADPNGGYVCLPQQAMPNAIAVKQISDEYAVVTTDGIAVYSYDEKAKGMVKNQNLSVSLPLGTNAIGVAVRQDTPDIWVLASDNSLTLYKFNGFQMAADPNLRVAGLNNVLSVSSWPDIDRAAVLSKSDATKTGTVTIYDVADGKLIPGLTFDTGLTDPVAVSVMPGTPDIVVANADAFYYYAYDDATGHYVPDDTRKATGLLSGILSVSSQQAGTAVLNSLGVAYYLQSSAGSYQSVAVLSASPISNPVALSIKPGTYDYAVLTQSGDVKYYTYDDSLGAMNENRAMEITGLLIPTGYLHPKEYYSAIINSGNSSSKVLLTVNQTLPPGTTVDWYVSSDGGLSWVAVTPGNWATITPGSQFVVHAVLDTSNSEITPKIFEVKLEAEDKTIIGITLNPTSMSVTGVNKFIGPLTVMANYSDGSMQDITNSVSWSYEQHPNLIQEGAIVAYVSGPGLVFSGPYVGRAEIWAIYTVDGQELISDDPCTVTVSPESSGVANVSQRYRKEIN